jgi:hypothetical protein
VPHLGIAALPSGRIDQPPAADGIGRRDCPTPVYWLACTVAKTGDAGGMGKAVPLYGCQGCIARKASQDARRLAPAQVAAVAQKQELRHPGVRMTGFLVAVAKKAKHVLHRKKKIL